MSNEETAVVVSVDAVVDAVVETPVEVVASTPVETVEAPQKVQHWKIFVDADGNETKRELLGRGRHPKGARKDENGNLIVSAVNAVSPDGTEEKHISMIITLDESGNEISRTEKTRGRPAKGLVKHEDGPYAGHWVRTQKTETAETAETTETSAVVVETPEVVVSETLNTESATNPT